MALSRNFEIELSNLEIDSGVDLSLSLSLYGFLASYHYYSVAFLFMYKTNWSPKMLASLGVLYFSTTLKTSFSRKHRISSRFAVLNRSPNSRLSPGARYSFIKTSDTSSLMSSHRWDAWIDTSGGWVSASSSGVSWSWIRGTGSDWSAWACWMGRLSCWVRPFTCCRDVDMSSAALKRFFALCRQDEVQSVLTFPVAGNYQGLLV